MLQGWVRSALSCRHHEGSPAEVPGSPDGDLFAEPWWADKLGAGDSAWWLGALNGERLAHLPGKQRVGLVNALVDLLRHLVRCLNSI